MYALSPCVFTSGTEVLTHRLETGRIATEACSSTTPRKVNTSSCREAECPVCYLQQCPSSTSTTTGSACRAPSATA